jgi:hypothetical protein
MDGGCQMSGDSATVVEATKEADDAQGRQRSTISFPYIDLNSAVDLVQAIHGNVGLGECDDSQLAAWTNQSIKSSGFRIQLSGARVFGLMATDGSGRHRLTDLGRTIVDPNQAREARARAFLAVPLFKAVFDNYKGGVLPPAAALARDMVGLGVAEKTKDRARQLFERSAEQAGFFAHGRNRLVMPAVAVIEEPPPDDDEETDRQNGGGGGGGGKGGIDPIIQGLLARLPKSGDVWPEAERKLWLELLSGSFRLIYKDKKDGGWNDTDEMTK